MITRDELTKVTAALRSGAYQQAFGGFYKPGDGPNGDEVAGCVLGIAAWVLQDGKPEQFTERAVRSLPPAQNILASKFSEDTAAEIINLNDCQRRPFAEIADWMDQHVPVEFDPRAASKADYQRWKVGFYNELDKIPYPTFPVEDVKYHEFTTA